MRSGRINALHTSTKYLVLGHLNYPPIQPELNKFSTTTVTFTSKTETMSKAYPTQTTNLISLVTNKNKIEKSRNQNNLLTLSEGVDENFSELYNTPMYFGTENSSIVIVQAGAVAHLPCTIHHIGEGVVSID